MARSSHMRIRLTAGVATLVVLAACDQGATNRLYTEDEITAIRARAAKNADREPASVMTVSMLSLSDVSGVLKASREEPSPLLGVQRAAEQFAEVRRVAQGGMPLVEVFVVQSGETAVSDTIAEILDRGELPPADLDALAATLDHVIASEPRLPNAFQGELRWLRGSILFSGSFTPASYGHDARDEIALTLAALDEMEPQLVSACPAQSSLATCHARLPARTEPQLAGTLIDKVVDKLGTSDAGDRRRLQSKLTHDAAQNFLGGYTFYVERAAADVTRLIALRVAIEVLRTKTCDVPAELLAPAVLGEPVVVQRLEGSLRISPPKWATHTKTEVLGFVSNPPGGIRARQAEFWDVSCP